MQIVLLDWPTLSLAQILSHWHGSWKLIIAFFVKQLAENARFGPFLGENIVWINFLLRSFDLGIKGESGSLKRWSGDLFVMAMGESSDASFPAIYADLVGKRTFDNRNSGWSYAVFNGFGLPDLLC